MRVIKTLVRRVLQVLGFRGWHIGRYLLVMRVAAEPGEPEVGAHPLERFLFESSLSQVLRRLDVNCVLDVGANQGQYGLMLRGLGYSGYIVSFEPVSEPFQALQAVARHDPKWSAHQWALDAQATRARIHVTRGTDFSSVLQPTGYPIERFGGSAPVERVEQVDVRRLDQVLRDVIAHIDRPRLFLKTDTQGYDLQVFAGAAGVIDRVLGLQSEIAPVPLYEGAPTMVEALRTFQSAGFELSELSPVSRDPDTARVLEYDCLMVRRNGLGSPSGSHVTPRDGRAGVG